MRFISALGPYLMFPLLVMGLRWIRIHLGYRNSSYGVSGGESSFRVAFDTGAYGEYLTYRMLESLTRDTGARLMANIYVPKRDGGTTEIDLVMIGTSGIYVFESKNYSGWIFGSDNQKMWTQSFRKGKRQSFYNPVWQNRGHITALKQVLPGFSDSVFSSVIVFSARCELKKVTVSTPGVLVVKRNHLSTSLSEQMNRQGFKIGRADVDQVFETLSQYVNVSSQVRREHIARLSR